MRVSSILIPFVLGAHTAYADARGDVITGIHSITDKIDIVGEAFDEWTGRVSDLRWTLFAAKAHAVLDEIWAATTKTKNGGNLTLDDSLKIRVPGDGLLNSTNITMINIAEARTKMEQRNHWFAKPIVKIIEHLVGKSLKKQRAASADFSNALVDAFNSTFAKGPARATGEKILKLIDSTIDVY